MGQNAPSSGQEVMGRGWTTWVFGCPSMVLSSIAGPFPVLKFSLLPEAQYVRQEEGPGKHQVWGIPLDFA